MNARERFLKPHYVYRCYDADDRLLYVGLSANLKDRLDRHRLTSLWFRHFARVDTETFPSKHAGHAAELAAIHSERPLYNRQGNQRRLSEAS